MKAFPGEVYKFAPKSFILPGETNEFLSQLSNDGKKKKTYIVKPDSGCQGKGIALVQTLEQAKELLEDYGKTNIENVVAQQYLNKPHLINGYKYDVRIYVMVLSCDPLRIFLYKEGLARFCTEQYVQPSEDNLSQTCMHLTNYAINKHNENFTFNQDADKTDEGSKWSMSSLFKYLDEQGFDVKHIWFQIKDMVVKTVLSIQPLLAHNYRMCLEEDNDGLSCFELLGLDIMLDSKGKPWLIEVNHSPSFTADTPLDLALKETLIRETLG